ncbi:LCCL domain superfamily [Sesbania bispinosa]|nr:LCCL domain superfamily [Sesbania bispinosa]
MSAVPERSHEETVHPSSKHSHQDSDTYSKLISSVSNDCHIPFDIDHPVGTEKRIESRDLKENKDLWFENRDLKTEKKELQDEAKRDSQIAKSEKDVCVEGRGDDSNKDIRYERDSHNDTKGDIKTEKDDYGLVSSHLNWKESKEHRGKRYSNAPSGSLDSWHISHGNTPSEVGKENSTAEERDFLEAHEPVGENKFDSKSEDRFKDRRKKDVKHQDWEGKEKERSDCRNSTQVNTNIGDSKESAKEDRDEEKWERERKDLPKEKEYSKEMEKDNMKGESWNGMDKEVSKNENELGDGSGKTPEQEIVLPEQKKQKDVESWKNVVGEARERRKRDTDLEGDRPEKRSKLDKQSEDGCADGEGTGWKGREVHNYNVQHHKRIQRSRGSPQVANREAHIRSHTQYNEESQGKPEVSSVVYKVGESMQGLIKLWKEYESSQSQMEKNGESSNNGPTLEIQIPAKNVTATNRQVRGGQLWGTDVYTYDSDLVAVLMHTGYCRPTASPPPMAIQELRATIRVLPPQDCYISTLRNNVRSRAWGAAIGGSYRVERCCIVKKGGGTIDLEPCHTHTSTIEPTLALVTVERTMTTRAAASNALRQQRLTREVTIQYNLCNEPWIKYSISIVADKGLKKPLYTSARLKKGEVLYLETHSCRYELCFTGEKMIKAIPANQLHDPDTEKSQNHQLHSTNGDKADSDNVMIDVFRWSRCKKPLPQNVMHTVGIPLPLEYVEVLQENLDWEDVQWSQTGVWIAGKEYTLARVHFLSMIVH